jgi:hypothetical protein
MFALLLSSVLSASAPGLDGVDLARLDLIRAVEADEANRSMIWLWSWSGLYIAGTVGQGVAVPFLKDPATQIDFIVGAVTTALGAAFNLVLPPNVIAGAKVVRALPDTPEGLAQAERRLEDDAAAQDFCVSWVMHGLNAAFNVATGLVLGLGFKHWESAVINTVSGIIIGEVMVLTTPHGLRQLVRPTAPVVVLRPMMGPNLTGLALGGTW